MARSRSNTFAMSTVTGPLLTPNASARDTVCAMPALQISFLLGRQLMFGQRAADPPAFDHRRSLTGLRQVPCEVFAAFTTPEDHGVGPALASS